MASLADLALLLPILAVGAGLIGYGLFALGQLIRLRRGAGIPASDTSRAIVSVEGTAVDVDDATVTSPLTGREALWYAYRVDGHGGDLTRPDWTPVAEGRDGCVFGVETGGDTVRVDPDGASGEDRRRGVEYPMRREDRRDFTEPIRTHADRLRSALRCQRSRAALRTVWRGPQAGSYNRLARTNSVIPTTLRPMVRPRCGRDCGAGRGSARPSRPRFPHRSGPTSRTRGTGARDRPRRRGLDGSRSERGRYN